MERAGSAPRPMAEEAVPLPVALARAAFAQLAEVLGSVPPGYAVLAAVVLGLAFRATRRRYEYGPSDHPLCTERLMARGAAELGTELLREKPLYCGHRKGGKTDLVCTTIVECEVADLVASIVHDLLHSETLDARARLQVFEKMRVQVPSARIKPSAMIFYAHLTAEIRMEFPYDRIARIYRLVQAYAVPATQDSIPCLAIFPSVTCVPHSCEANVFHYARRDGQLCWLPLRRLEDGEAWTRSWLPASELVLPTGLRTLRLKQLGVTCDCSRCTTAPERTLAYECPACKGLHFCPVSPYRLLVDPVTATVKFRCEDCGFSTSDDRAIAPSKLHYQSVPPDVKALGDDVEAINAVVRARQRLRRVLGLHPDEANLAAVEAGLRGEDPDTATALRQRFFGWSWREANQAKARSPWMLDRAKLREIEAYRNDKGEGEAARAPLATRALAPKGTEDDGLGIDGDGAAGAPSAPDVNVALADPAAVLAKAQALLAAGAAASAACNAPTRDDKQVWARISELQGLVTNARGERKQLDALAACLDEKKAEIQRVIDAQETEKNRIRQRRARNGA